MVGEAAKDALIANPNGTIFDAKRLIGRSYLDLDVQKDIKNFPFEVVRRGDGSAILVGDTAWSPEEISAQVLLNLKETAEKYIRESVEVSGDPFISYWITADDRRTLSSLFPHTSTMPNEQQLSTLRS